MLGTSKKAPVWFVECALMEQFGWTEEQLYDQNSLSRITKISTYNEVRAEAEKERARRDKINSQSGPAGTTRSSVSKRY